MTDSPTNPDDPNLTTRYDPATADAPADAAPAPATPPPAAPPATPPPRAPTWGTHGDDPGRVGTILFGVLLVAIGLWFFADQTLGLDMPRLRWSELWPILIILLGGWIVLGSMRRES